MTMQTQLVQQGDSLIIANSQDCTPIAERAKRLHNDGAFGSSDMKLAASIPQVIVEKYCNERGISFEQFMADPKHIKRVAEDPDNAMFRVWKGRI